VQFDAETPKKYLALPDEDRRRERLLAIREMLLKVLAIVQGICWWPKKWDRFIAMPSAQSGDLY